jgi:nitrogen fixation-related uncharacterized protein
MVIIETGLLWRLVAKRFEDRVAKAEKDGFSVCEIYSNQFDTCEAEAKRSLIQLRLLLVAKLVKYVEPTETK